MATKITKKMVKDVLNSKGTEMDGHAIPEDGRNMTWDDYEKRIRYAISKIEIDYIRNHNGKAKVYSSKKAKIDYLQDMINRGMY